jgi:hypothetical protein
MSYVESLKPFAYALPVGPQAQVWDCSNRGQVMEAAFDVHEAAVKAGFMPDEATSLSLSLAELCSQAVLYARGAIASVFFTDTGWRLEVADSAPTSERITFPVLHSVLPRPLSSLRVWKGKSTVIIAEYQRDENA